MYNQNNFNDIQIGDAVREKLIGAIMLQAPSGAGKTTGALILAFGMMRAKYPDLPENEVWGKIAVIDTEHRRALVNVNMLKGDVKIGVFKHIPLGKPYSVDRLVFALGLAHNQQCEVAIIDSTSHFWEGEGGIMDYQQELGGRFQDWKEANKEMYYPFIDAVTGVTHEMHIINTARTKQEHVMDIDEDTGKRVVKKLGLKPVQRDSLEYEFQVVFNIDMEHKARVSKDNSGLFLGMSKTLTTEHGKLLYQWLDEGKDIIAERQAEAERLEQQRIGLAMDIKAQAESFGLTAWLGQVTAHPYFGSDVELLPLDKLEEIRVQLQKQMEAMEQNAQNS